MGGSGHSPRHMPPRIRPERGASLPPPPPPPLGYLGPGRRRRRRRRRGLSASNTCFAEKPPPPPPPPPALSGLQLQPPPPPGPEHAPGSRSSSWPPATASSSCPSSLGCALPNPHWPTAAAAAAAAAAVVRAVTVSGSPGPAGSAPPLGPAPSAQAPPLPAARPFFGRRLRPLASPLPHRAVQSPPVPGRVQPPGTRCLRRGETILGAASGLRLSQGRGRRKGRGLRSRVPELTRVAAPPSALGPEPSFVFQAEGLRWLWGPCPMLGGAVELGELPLATPLTLLSPKATPGPLYSSVIRVPFQSIKFR